MVRGLDRRFLCIGKKRLSLVQLIFIALILYVLIRILLPLLWLLILIAALILLLKVVLGNILRSSINPRFHPTLINGILHIHWMFNCRFKVEIKRITDISVFLNTNRIKMEDQKIRLKHLRSRIKHSILYE